MKKYHIKGYTEDKTLQTQGAPYKIEGFGTVLVRRGGLAAWKEAMELSKKDIFGSSLQSEYIDPYQEQAIIAKTVANYSISKLLDDCVDAHGNRIHDSKINICAIFEDPDNYSLVEEIVQVSFSQELYLAELVKKETNELKKS